MGVLLIGLGTFTRDGFATMIDYTSPVFWTFLTLSGFAVILLRWRHPELPRPFRVPFFPLLPLLFCASCLFVLWSSLACGWVRWWGWAYWPLAASRCRG